MPVIVLLVACFGTAARESGGGGARRGGEDADGVHGAATGAENPPPEQYTYAEVSGASANGISRDAPRHSQPCRTSLTKWQPPRSGNPTGPGREDQEVQTA